MHIHKCDQMPLYLYSECNLRLLHPSISLSLWRLLFLCSAFLSLCVTFLLHEEPQSGLIIFGLFIHFAFEPGYIQTHTDVLTDVKMHSVYDTSVLIGFQAKNACSLAMKHSDAAVFITLLCLNRLGSVTWKEKINANKGYPCFGDPVWYQELLHVSLSQHVCVWYLKSSSL